ncbi:LysR family transcriptional regulator [Hydrogenophaga sp. OTU3427]|uniref:LysR family transcriptional regulator n=1 Tax=Hydrogenophaga sp. OTU3427 TaxID=3043856 RepID=UPI00313EC53C
MNLRQLETLVWTCRLGSVRQAARQLGTSQPAASARLRELEEHLGISLLLRDMRPVRITPQGREILRLAESMIELAGRMEHHANSASPIYGTVRLGANHGTASSWLPALLHAVYEKLPGVEVELVVEISERLTDLLRGGKLDAAFVLGRVDDAAIGYSRLYEVQLEWAASRLCTGLTNPVTPKSLARFPVSTDAEGSPIHRAVVGWFRAANVKPRRVDICSGPVDRLNLARNGDWVTVVPTTVLSSYAHAADFVSYASDPPLEPMEVGVAYRAASEVGETVQHVVSVSRDVIQDWMRHGRRVS